VTKAKGARAKAARPKDAKAKAQDVKAQAKDARAKAKAKPSGHKEIQSRQVDPVRWQHAFGRMSSHLAIDVTTVCLTKATVSVWLAV